MAGYDDVLAGIAIVLFAIAALAVNSLAIWCICAKDALHNSFGTICMSHSIGELVGAAITLFWCAPLVMFLDHSAWSKSSLCFALIQINMWTYFAILYNQLVKSLNRLFAIARPAFYLKHCTVRNTAKALAITWTISALQCVVFAFDGCHAYFDGATYFWMLETTPCGDALNLYMNIYVACSVMAAIILCDFTTLCFLRHYRNLQRSVVLKDAFSTTHSSDESNGHGRSASFARDIRFFLQSAIFALFYVVLNLSQRFLGPDDFSHWSVRLLVGSISWLVGQILDGALVVGFSWHLT